MLRWLPALLLSLVLLTAGCGNGPIPFEVVPLAQLPEDVTMRLPQRPEGTGVIMEEDVIYAFVKAEASRIEIRSVEKSGNGVEIAYRVNPAIDVTITQVVRFAKPWRSSGPVIFRQLP